MGVARPAGNEKGSERGARTAERRGREGGGRSKGILYGLGTIALGDIWASGVPQGRPRASKLSRAVLHCEFSQLQ